MSLVMNKNENSLWLSVLLLAIIGVTIDSFYIEVLIYWVIIILSVGNAKRIILKNQLILGTFIRRSVYIIPLLLPLMISPYIIRESNINFVWILLGVLVGITFIIPKYKTWKLVLSNDYISMTVNQSRSHYIMAIYTLIGGAIAEEMFFRIFLLSEIGQELVDLFILIPLSSLMFMLLHFGTKWSRNFSNYDLIMQLLFGTISAILFILSESIFPSIMAHLTYNMTYIIQNIKYLIYFKGKDENYESY